MEKNGDDGIRVFKEPTHLPKGWLFFLVGVSVTLAYNAFATGSWRGAMETRASVIESRQDRQADAYLRLNQKVDIILQSTSRIEGQNELILKRLK